MASWSKKVTSGSVVGGALLAAVAAFSSGCGGSGNVFLPETLVTTTATATSTATSTSTATATGTQTPNGGPVNAVEGTITLGSGVTTEPTITLFQGTTQVAQTVAAANGTYSFPNLSPGNYTILLTGTGLRQQSDNVTLTAGSGFTMNYTMSLLAGAPSQQEVSGIAASALHTARAFSGIHLALPLANILLNFNEAITARQGGQIFVASPPIQVPGAQQVAIDSHGHAWVTDTVGTDGEVTVLSNLGTLVGQFPSNGSNPNKGAQPIAIDSNNDVAVANNGTGTFGVFPAADVHAVTLQQSISFGQTANAIAAQNGNVTVGHVAFNDPHFVATQTVPGGAPALIFFDKNSGADISASSSVVAGLPVGSTVQGVTVASDNTIFVAANVFSSGSTTPEILHLSADGSTNVETAINLTANSIGLTTGDVAKFVALDTSGDIFVGVQPIGNDSGVLKIGPAGNRTLLASNATVPGGLTLDSSNDVFITNGTVATQFDDNLANASTGTVGAGAGSIAVDANGNAFVVSPGVNQVTRLTVGAAVGPQSGNTTTTASDDSQITTTVANGNTTVTQVFSPGVQDEFSFGPTVVSGSSSQVTLNSTAAFGPTTSSLLSSVNAATGLTTYTVKATNGIDGVAVNSTVQVNLDGSESVSGTSSEGLTYSATYNAPSTASPQGGANGGSVFMEGVWSDSTTGDKGTIQLTIADDGSLFAFTLVDTTRQLVVTSNSTGVSYSSTVTVEGSQTVQGTATSNPFQDVLLAFNLGTSPDVLGNFVIQGALTGGVNFLSQGMTVTGGSPSTITAAQMTSSTATPVTGQGDGPDLDAGAGAGTFTAFDGGGAGGNVRGTK